MLPVYVINLRRRPDRLERVTKRFVELGVTISRFEAVDSSEIDSTGVVLAPFRSTPNAKYACWLSHSGLRDQISRGQADYALILEDDARPATGVNWPKLLEKLPTAMRQGGLGYLQLGFISHFYRWTRTGLLDEFRARLHQDSQLTLALDVHRTAILGSVRAGNHAYVVSREFVLKVGELRPTFNGSTDGFYDGLSQRSGDPGNLLVPAMARLRHSIVEQESRMKRMTPLDSDIEQRMGHAT